MRLRALVVAALAASNVAVPSPARAVAPKPMRPGGPKRGDLGPRPAARASAAHVAVATARAQVGKPYRWAGSGPDAFDCSGLTMFSWGAAGVGLPHSSAAQYSSLPKVPRDRLRPGDLVYSRGHIGLYVGDGKMIHAPQSGKRVEVAPLRPNLIGAARPAA